MTILRVRVAPARRRGGQSYANRTGATYIGAKTTQPNPIDVRWSGKRRSAFEDAVIHFIKGGIAIENGYVGKLELEMPKDNKDSREKRAPKSLTDVLEALVKEEFAQNRRPIVDQIAAEAANRMLGQNSH